MKKVLMMVVGIMMLAGAANATGPAAFMGLYADLGHTVQEAIVAAPFTPFDVYVFILPSDNGVTAAEFKTDLTGAAAVLALAPVTNLDIITISDGSPFGAPGVKVTCFCEMDWFWTHKLPFYMTGLEPGFIEIFPHDLIVTQAQVAGCDGVATIETLFPINKFGLNQDGVVPDESSTWGAIKSLINE